MKNVVKQRMALAPYTVLDLTDESGAFCTKILAALGADVIKIEPPGGHRTRRIGPFYHDDPDPEKSLHWFTYNLSKKSITLNIECATGQDIFKRLVKIADFVVECFHPGYIDNLGLGYSTLNSINPRIIVTSITPFGASGPYHQFKGSSLVCSALSGSVYICGDKDRPPVQFTTPAAYLETGVQASAATMVAFWYRQQTGKGQHVDVSVQESFLAQRSAHAMFWKSRGVIPSRDVAGPYIPGVARYRTIFKCKDGYVLCHTTYARGRQPLREWLASEGMAGDLFDKKWDQIFLEGIPVTVEMKQHIDDVFGAFAISRSKDQIMLEAQKRGVQVAKVQTVPDVIEDEHLRQRGYFVEVEHPELNDTILFGGAPFKSVEMSWEYRRRAPLIGEHNQEIYGEKLGLSHQELVTLKEGGVI